MYALITIFYVSLLAMIAMVAFKRHEALTGVPSFVSKVGAGSDHVFQAAYSTVRHGLSYINRRTFIALVQWLAFHVLKFFRTLYVEIKHRFISTDHGKKLIDAVRGRGEVSTHGASFFLRNIAADGKHS
jgi:hypothetical protein